MYSLNSDSNSSLASSQLLNNSLKKLNLSNAESTNSIFEEQNN